MVVGIKVGAYSGSESEISAKCAFQDLRVVRDAIQRHETTRQ